MPTCAQANVALENLLHMAPHRKYSNTRLLLITEDAGGKHKGGPRRDLGMQLSSDLQQQCSASCLSLAWCVQTLQITLAAKV